MRYLGYPNRFSDGHNHNQNQTSPKGLPQCTKCGRVFPSGKQLQALRSNKPKNKTKTEKKVKTSVIRASPKPSQPKITVNVPSNELQPSNEGQLMGLAYNIVKNYSRYEAEQHLKGYLKNRRALK